MTGKKTFPFPFFNWWIILLEILYKPFLYNMCKQGVSLSDFQICRRCKGHGDGLKSSYSERSKMLQFLGMAQKTWEKDQKLQRIMGQKTFYWKVVPLKVFQITRSRQTSLTSVYYGNFLLSGRFLPCSVPSRQL